MSLPFRIDYALAMSDGIGPEHGLSDAALDVFVGPAAKALESVLARVKAKELGFWDLPLDRGAADAVVAYVASLPPAITDVLVLGIGGSSLGARAVQQALAPAEDLVDPAHAKRRLHLPDNADPHFFAAMLTRLDPRRTLVVATSKSGGTVETAAQLVIADRWLATTLGDRANDHLVLITDPDKGAFRELARARGLSTFPIPANVGGRFSVLTAVGTLPAALIGADVHAMLEGAREARAACESTDLRKNPALLLAALHRAHHVAGRGIHVFMPYSDALRPFAAWFVQLWAESLGKRLDRAGRRVEVGPTPLAAVGATDQHAQVQLFMEGPRDKLVTFLAVEHAKSDLAIPRTDGPFAYLGGKSLATLLAAEQRGTALALAEDGRPSLTLSIDAVDARSLGALFFLYEAATAIAGELYDVDAFDQPGVELGKRLAFALLGREGFDTERESIARADAKRNAAHRLT